LNKTSKNAIYESGVYFRAVNELFNEKQRAFTLALEHYKNGDECDKIFIVSKQNFRKIPGKPFLYWISERIIDLFKKNENANRNLIFCRGLASGDNFRFVRFWWEIGKKKIYFNCRSVEETKILDYKWYPFMKGGTYSKWYGNQECVVNWQFNGKEIRNFFKNGKLASRPQGTKYYFKEGCSYTTITTGNFSMRYMPNGFIFADASNGIFPGKLSINETLGIYNSSFVSYLIKVLNPTVNITLGDLGNIPIHNKEVPEIIATKAEEAIKERRAIITHKEISWEFVSPPHWETGSIETLEREKQLAIFESEISEAMYELYDIVQEGIEQIESEFGQLPGHFPKIINLKDEKLRIIKSLYLEKHVPSKIIKQNKESTDKEAEEKENIEQASSGRKGRSKRFLTLEEICLASCFHPETVYEYIKLNNLERNEERFDLAVRYISYALGVVMGRFEVNGIKPDDDGITVMDEGHSDDATARVQDVLDKILNEKEAKEVINIIGRDLRKFLMNDFFVKYHTPMYKKRPVYWLLQTAKRNYGFYIYNLKFTQDTLYSLIQKYIVPRINLEKLRLKDIYNKKETANTQKEKREIENLIVKSEGFMEELKLFKQNIQEVIDTGFKPDIDDGVILNMAPLYKLIPWKEPEKYYKDLQMGRYEWANVSKYFKK